MTELKPCPFCGGAARIRSAPFGESGFIVGCSHDGAMPLQLVDARLPAGKPVDCLFRGFFSGSAIAAPPKGKAHRPYEFGVKASVATTLNR
jgi:hypothetical protein